MKKVIPCDGKCGSSVQDVEIFKDISDEHSILMAESVIDEVKTTMELICFYIFVCVLYKSKKLNSS